MCDPCGTDDLIAPEIVDCVPSPPDDDDDVAFAILQVDDDCKK
jgi:hypothetical protein